MFASALALIVRYLGVYILCFAVGFYAHIRWERYWEGDSGKNTPTLTETVKEVASGNLVYVEAGIFGKQTRSIILYGIEIPMESEMDAKNNLSLLVAKGDTISIAIKEGRAVFGDIVGIIHSRLGVNCNIEQVRLGFAKTNTKDKDFLLAQKEAQQAHRGIWKNPDNPKPKPWWHDEEKEK